MTTCSHCGHVSDRPFPYCPACGTQQVPGGPGGLVGRLLGGKYRVLQPIGAGSMGTVYLAEHAALRKRVALKILHKELLVSDEAWKRFHREGVAAGQVNHPNAIQIFDFDRTEEGVCFLAMEHVEGDNLKQWLARSKPVPAAQALALARQLLSTLAEAHRHGIVHRDLKPENLMVTRDADGNPALKVLDFGLSKLVNQPLDVSLLTMSGRVLGTPLYMAPEQWHGEEVDARADLYATALILFEMLTGRQPFQGSNLTEILVKSTTTPPPSLLEQALPLPVPVDLDPLLQKGLAKARDERFQSATEMLEALDRVRLDRVASGGGAPPRRVRRPAPRPARAAPSPMARRRTLLLAAGAGLVAVAVLGPQVLGGGGTHTAPLASMLPRESLTEDQRGYLALLDEARDALRSRRGAAAVAVLDKAVRHPCVDAEAFALRGAAFREQREPDAAAQDYTEALQRHPGFGFAAAGLGWLQLDRERLDEAEQRFRSAIAIDAGCADGPAGLGAVLLRRGQIDAAATLLAAAAERFPDQALVHLHRGQTQLALQQLDAAVQSFAQARRHDPTLHQAQVGLADAYLRKGNASAAEQQLVSALEFADRDPASMTTVRRRLAELQLGQQRFDDAIRTLAPALAVAEPSGDLYVLQGLAEHGRGNLAAAVRELERGLERGAAEPAAVQLLLGQLLLEAGRHREATVHLEAATLADPGTLTKAQLAKAFLDWGIALFRLGEYEAAAFKLETSVRFGDDPLARHCLGVLYMDYLAQPDEAAAHLQAYRVLGGDDPRVADWLRRLGH